MKGTSLGPFSHCFSVFFARVLSFVLFVSMCCINLLILFLFFACFRIFTKGFPQVFRLSGSHTGFFCFLLLLLFFLCVVLPWWCTSFSLLVFAHFSSHIFAVVSFSGYLLDSGWREHPLAGCFLLCCVVGLITFFRDDSERGGLRVDS